MRIAYLRVSTEEQKPDRQIDGLKDVADELHIEKLSAATLKRPVYEAVIEKLKRGDTFVVWALDRAYRSTIDALLEIDKLRARGIAFEIVQFPLDTSKPESNFVLTIIAAFAELERTMISRRTKEGLAAARRRGKRLGRPPKVPEDQLAQIRAAIESGTITVTAMAEALGVARWTLSRALRRQSARQDAVDGATSALGQPRR